MGERYAAVDILLVEDNATDAELCIRALKKNNLANSVRWVMDGAEALEAVLSPASSYRPKVILLDLRLPKIDGLDVLQTLRADERTKMIPIVVLTSSREDHDIARAYELGANSFITKPVEFDEFVSTVGQLGLYWLVVNKPPAPAIPRVRKDMFVGTLAAYLGVPLVTVFFILACTMAISSSVFENVVFDASQRIFPSVDGRLPHPAKEETTGKNSYAADTSVGERNEHLILASHPNEPFKQTTYLAPDGLLWKKWLPVESSIESEMRIISECQVKPQKCPAGAATKFNDILSEALKHEGRARLGIINRETNLAIKYTTDSRQFGVSDYWATPFETLGSGMGDCEDYAITKHAILRAAKWPTDDLRIVVLWDSLLRDFHAVEAVRDRGTWWVLDNRSMTIAEDQNLRHYHPLFIIDDVSVRQLRPSGPVGGFRISDRILTNAGDEIASRGLCGDYSLAMYLVRMLTSDWATGWADTTDKK
jgi:two-component system response regulator